MAIKKAGGQSALALKLDVNPQAVQQWERAPDRRVIEISKAADFSPTPHQLRPDLYPHPEDGLPPELRGRAL